MKTKFRLYDKSILEYIEENTEYVSQDGSQSVLLDLLDAEYNVFSKVETELASDVYIDDRELYENDVIALNTGFFGVVAFKKGQFGVRVNKELDMLVAERHGTLNDPNVFVPFTEIEHMRYIDTIHAIDKYEKFDCTGAMV